MSYIKYIQNEDHYKEVLSKVANLTGAGIGAKGAKKRDISK